MSNENNYLDTDICSECDSNEYLQVEDCLE